MNFNNFWSNVSHVLIRTKDYKEELDSIVKACKSQKSTPLFSRNFMYVQPIDLGNAVHSLYKAKLS